MTSHKCRGDCHDFHDCSVQNTCFSNVTYWMRHHMIYHQTDSMMMETNKQTISFLLQEKVPGISNISCQSWSSCSIWWSQIYLAFSVTHSARKVPVCGGNTHLQETKEQLDQRPRCNQDLIKQTQWFLRGDRYAAWNRCNLPVARSSAHKCREGRPSKPHN